MAETAFSPAGFWKRYVAYSIDVVLVYLAVEALAHGLFADPLAGHADQLQAIVASMQDPQATVETQTAQLGELMGLFWKITMLATLAYAAIGGAYFALCESSPWQATLGKRLVGIKVTDANGARIGVGRALGRFFAAGLSWLTMNIGHALAAFGSERRALHDYVAGTRVENADPAHPRMPAWGWWILAAQALLLLLAIVGFAMAIVAVLNGSSLF
jgi:uncharacterized RDD family membrane protein YckC